MMLSRDINTNILQFLSDVVTAAGLIEHGKKSKALAERLSNNAYLLRSHFVKQPPPELTDVELDQITEYQWGKQSQPMLDAYGAFARAVEREVRKQFLLKERNE